MGGAAETRIMGGERVKPPPPVLGGERVKPLPPVPGGEQVRPLSPVLGGERVKPLPPVPGGEWVKPPPPVPGGEVETTAVEDGGTEGVGARLVRTLVLEVVVVDGVPPPRRTTLLVQPNRSRRRRLSMPTPRFRPHQIPPGVSRVLRGAHPASLRTRLPTPGVLRTTVGVRLLGVPQMKPYRANPQVALAQTKGRGRKRIIAFRAVGGRVGAKRRTLRIPPVWPHLGEGAGGTLPLLSLRLPVPSKVLVPRFFLILSQLHPNGTLTQNRFWPLRFYPHHLSSRSRTSGYGRR